MFNFSLIDDSESTLKKCGIYKITCTANGKFYVGCTYNSFRNRLLSHRSELKRSKHYAYYMQNSFNKYNIESFQIEILEVLDKSDTETIFARENYWIELLQPHFNYPPTANSIIYAKAEGDPERKLHVNNTSGHRNISVLKKGCFRVAIDNFEIGTFKHIEEAVEARNAYLLNPVYKEPKPRGQSGERCIQYHNNGWVVEVNRKYVGFFKELQDAINARDEFLLLPTELQLAKVCQSNTGHKNIQYRERTDRYRVVFADDEIASSCKTLDEAIQVRDRFLLAGERPLSQKAGTGCKYIQLTKSGSYSFVYKRKKIGTYGTLVEAINTRDAYIQTQNKLAS